MSRSEMVGVLGLILAGDFEGWHVQVDDDSENTGGYLILVWKVEKSSGFDDWVETKDALHRYFDERGWIVRWEVGRDEQDDKGDGNKGTGNKGDEVSWPGSDGNL